MEKERKITAPDGCKKTKVYKISAPNGCEIEKVEIVDGMAVVTFKEKERKLPKSWEEFCEICKVKEGEAFISQGSGIFKFNGIIGRDALADRNVLPDRATAEAVLALIQLVQLRNCYNGDWVPDWKNKDEIKYIIQFYAEEIQCETWVGTSASPLYFKTKELRYEFLRYFRPLIEKLKPLYGIKEGGEG